MQHSHFETSGYQPGALYNPGYDTSALKVHHGHFQDTIPGDYSNFLGQTGSPGSYIPRDPPTYAETALFNSNFIQNNGNAYHKLSPSQEYDIQRTQENMLSKPDMLDHSNAHIMELHNARYETGTERLGLDATQTTDVSQIKIENSNGEFKTEGQNLNTSGQEGDVSLEGKEDSKAADKEMNLADPEKGHDEKAHGNADVKPALSYIALIAKSILESQQKRLSLGSIYGWIEKNYPYFLNKGQGWRNSVRHNLSLNDCFIKAGRCEDGKGNYWAIHPANIQDFMRGDFRQRRRSRRRGRKKDCDLGMYHGYGTLPPSVNVPFNPAATSFSSIYSPYTDAERRAYRLDEALLRQSMNNPFMKWYQPGVTNSTYPTQSTSCNSSMYGAPAPSQWQTYNDQNYALNSPLSR